jgi:hypothetical protein
MDDFIAKANKNTFYSVSRREAEYPELEKMGFENWREFRDKLDQTSEPRLFPAKVTPNDEYSLINCCGDFQLASKEVWHKVKGFEENMIYACFADSNIQKKAVLNGFGLEVLYNPPLFHMEHGAYYTKEDGTRVLDSENKGSYQGDSKAYNSVWDWVETFNESHNPEEWGWGNIEIEFEVF